MLQRPIDPEEMLSLVEGEQRGIEIPPAKRREIEATPENRALYAELSASVRALRSMPLRDAPASVWAALDAAHDEAFGARERTAASESTPTAGSGVVRSVARERARIRRLWTRAVAAACLVAAGITIWTVVRTGDDPNLAPNGLRFVQTSVARVVDDLSPAGEGRVDHGLVVFSFLTKTQTLYQGDGALDLTGDRKALDGDGSSAGTKTGN